MLLDELNRAHQEREPDLDDSSVAEAAAPSDSAQIVKAVVSRDARFPRAAGEVGVATEMLLSKAEQVSDDGARAAGLRLQRQRPCRRRRDRSRAYSFGPPASTSALPADRSIVGAREGAADEQGAHRPGVRGCFERDAGVRVDRTGDGPTLHSRSVQGLVHLPVLSRSPMQS